MRFSSSRMAWSVVGVLAFTSSLGSAHDGIIHAQNLVAHNGEGHDLVAHEHDAAGNVVLVHGGNAGGHELAGNVVLAGSEMLIGQGIVAPGIAAGTELAHYGEGRDVAAGATVTGTPLGAPVLAGHHRHRPKPPPPPPIVVRVATPFATGHILAATASEFERLLEARSRGRIDVQVSTGVLNEQTINPAMQSCVASERVADILITGGQPLQDYAPAYFFFNGPYVIEDYEHFQRVYAGELGQEARALIAQNSNLVAFGSTVYRGFRQFTSNEPIESPADFQGLLLRLPPVPDWVAVWSSLGVQPVQIPLGGIYDALATGVADASEGDLTQISSLELFEVQSHLSLTSHLVGFGMVLANECFLDDLSRRNARRLRRALADAAEWGSNQMASREAALLDSLELAGMEVVQPDADAIREAARPAIDQLFSTAWTVTTWDEVLAQ